MLLQCQYTVTLLLQCSDFLGPSPEQALSALNDFVWLKSAVQIVWGLFTFSCLGSIFAPVLNYYNTLDRYYNTKMYCVIQPTSIFTCIKISRKEVMINPISHVQNSRKPLVHKDLKLETTLI